MKYVQCFPMNLQNTSEQTTYRTLHQCSIEHCFCSYPYAKRYEITMAWTVVVSNGTNGTDQVF